MNDILSRRKQVLRLAAHKAVELPRLTSGFWYHQDMRDNLYYAMHLYAACADPKMELDFDRSVGISLASGMLQAVLALQIKEPGHPMYSHWPLNLGDDPSQAAPNTLPVELLGSLIALFYTRFQPGMEEQLRLSFEETIRVIYLGNYYRKPAVDFNHHESKYIAQQLIWGELFHDRELLEEGKRNLRLTMDTIQANGMREYGALPWFWHWVQAYASARELVHDPEAHGLLDDMLTLLWSQRAAVYLRGAWAGPHSRVLPHDMPADRNNLPDYIQFGDFTLPASISRLEGAAIVHMEPSATEAVALAANRSGCSEVRKRIPVDPRNVEAECRHAYVYLTPDYAVGGVWERADEYLNEQHRWDVTLPVQADGTSSKLYFFQPGTGYSDGDPRHQSGGSQVVLHRHTAAALYTKPEASDAADMIGVLPHGEWLADKRLLTGKVGNVYMIINLMHPFRTVKLEKYMEVRSTGSSYNGVAVEAIDEKTAAACGWQDLTAVHQAAVTAAAGNAVFTAAAGGHCQAGYTSLTGSVQLELQVDAEGRVVEQRINGSSVSFDNYFVLG